MLVAWIAVASAAGLAGAITLLLGMRGRRVDAHPWCRRCKYDLSGVPDAGACPECGARLTRRRAVRVGRRRRRPWCIAAGAILLAIGLGGGGQLAWKPVRAIEWNDLKPVWWLRLEATGGDRGRAETARKVLLFRLRDDELSTRQARAIVEDAIEVQADVTQPFPRTWSTLIEESWAKGLIADDVLERYFDNALPGGIRFDPLPRAQSGGTLLAGAVVPVRRGLGGGIFVARPWVDAVRIGDRFAWFQGTGQTSFSSFPSSVVRAGKEYFYKVDVSAFAEPGTYPLEVACGVAFVPRGDAIRDNPALAPDRNALRRHRLDSDSRHSPTPWTPETVPPFHRIYTSRHTLEIVEREDQVVARIEDPALDEALRRRASVRATYQVGEDGPMLRGTVAFTDLPANLLVETLVRASVDGNEPFGPPERTRPGFRGEDHSVSVGVRMDEEIPETVDVVVRTLEQVWLVHRLDSIWAGELVFRNVPVERLEPRPPRQRDEDERRRRTPIVDDRTTPEVLASLLGDDRATLQKAERVLLARLAGDDPLRVDAAIAPILERQADVDGPWNDEWGNVFETAWRKGLVAPDAFEAYARGSQGGDPKLRVRGRARRGAGIPFVIELPLVRAGNPRQRDALGIEYIPLGARLDGRPVPLEMARAVVAEFATRRPPRRPLPAPTARYRLQRCRGVVRSDVAPGRYRCEVDVQIRITSRSNRSTREADALGGRPAAWDEYPTHLAWTITLADRVEVVPADEPTVGLEMDESAFLAASDGAAAFFLKATIDGGWRRGWTRLTGQVRIPRADHAIGADVMIEYGGMAVAAGPILVPPGFVWHGQGFVADVPTPDRLPATATITLVPQVVPAEATHDITTVIGRPIEFGEVPIAYARERARAARAARP